MPFRVAIVLFFACFFSITSLRAQTPGRYVKIGNDTVYMLKTIDIVVNKKTKKIMRKQDTKQYRWLEKKVKKVYPLAVTASELLDQYQGELALVESEMEKRKIMKKIEKELIAQYGDTLKGLTITEGRILLKLIDRETGSTPYLLLDEMRGAFSATMWQGLATLFGHDLKARYNPYTEDRDIEEIVVKIERGEL
jgi:hypothetical protein